MNKRNLAKGLAVCLALAQPFSVVTAFATETSNPVVNATSGQAKVTLDNQYWYNVRIPALINLTYDQDSVTYKDDYDLQVCGEIHGKKLQIETDDINISRAGENLTLENYIGRADKGEKNHKYVLGNNEGERELDSKWQSVNGRASHSAHGVKSGTYTGTANYKFKLVDDNKPNEKADKKSTLSAASQSGIYDDNGTLVATAEEIAEKVKLSGSYAKALETYYPTATGIVIDDTVESLKDCKTVKTVVVKSNNRSYIVPVSMFAGCTALENVILPENTTSIHIKAFELCSSLKHVNIPESVKTIKSHAFENSGLVEVTIPASMQLIGSDAFLNCPLKNVNFINTESWKVQKTATAYEDMDVSNSNQMAEKLSSGTYAGYAWLRN